MDGSYGGRAIWTFGHLPNAQPSQAFSSVRMFVEEIDNLFGVTKGTCTRMFETLSQMELSDALKEKTIPGCLYAERLSFGEESITIQAA